MENPLVIILTALISLVLLLAQLQLFSIASSLRKILYVLEPSLPTGPDCPHCGGRLIRGRSACRYCGRDVDVAPVEAVPSKPGRTVDADGLAVCGTCGYHLSPDGSKLCKCPS
jgi:hypothetical protein